MPWNPDVYNQFKNIRYQPFFDLLHLISDENVENAIDIGCGTGEQTKILSDKFQRTVFLGIDSSPEMLEKSKEFKSENLSFKQTSTEELIASCEKYDLIFSNAALQWSDNHEKLFPELMRLINDKGQFAVQMPVQNENILNQILFQLASEDPFKTQLNNWNPISSVLSIDDYAEMMFENSFTDLNISIKVYPIIAKDTETLFQFISGSALIPYLEKLSDHQKNIFVKEYKKRIDHNFKKFPAIYPFKRLLLYGKKCNSRKI